MSRKTMWALAARNGLYLSILTVVIEIVKTFLQKGGDISVPGLFPVLTLIKTVGSAYVLYYFMKAFSKEKEYISYSESFRYGFSVSLFSSLVCAAFIVLSYTIIAPGILENIVEETLTTYSQMGISIPGMDYDNLMKMLPMTLFFSQFLSCIIFGLIYSLIMANYTKKGTFFSEETEGNTSDQKNEEE